LLPTFRNSFGKYLPFRPVPVDGLGEYRRLGQHPVIVSGLYVLFSGLEKPDMETLGWNAGIQRTQKIPDLSSL